MLKRLSILLFAALAASCHDGPEVRVKTEGWIFHAPNSPFEFPLPVVVPFQVTNEGERTRYLFGCANEVQPAVEYRVGDGWEPYSIPGCDTGVPVTPIALRAGETIDSRLLLAGVGSYRMRLTWADDPSMSGRTSSATSNGFVIR